MQRKIDPNVAVRRTMTIHRSPAEIYQFWRELRNAATFVHGVASVEVLDQTHSRWSGRLPYLGRERWNSTLLRDEKDRLMTWEGRGEKTNQYGRVEFRPAPGGHGTAVTLEMRFEIPGGRVGSALAKLTGRSPEDYVVRTLYSLRQLMETGEVATNKGPSGRVRGKRHLVSGGVK